MSENDGKVLDGITDKMPTKRKALGRFAQLSPEKKAALTSEKAEVSLHAGLSSFTGEVDHLPYFEKAFEQMKSACASFACGGALLEGFVAYCNSTERNSKRSFETAQSQLKNGFLLFLKESKLEAISIAEIDQKIVNTFIFWLKNLEKKGEHLSENTARRYYGAFKEVFGEINNSKTFKGKIVTVIAFPVNPFPDAHRDKVSTEVIDDVTFRALHRACVLDATETIRDVNHCLMVLSGNRITPDFTRRGRGQYESIDAAIWAYSDIFDEFVKKKIVPFLKDVKEGDNAAFSGAVQYTHGLDAIIRGFFPTAAEIFPFVLLLAIYSMANTGPLRSLSLKNIGYKEVIGVKRLVMKFVKNRGPTTYPRTFAIDENAPFSPDEIIKFLKKWSEKIRPLAGDFSAHLFIFATSFGSVRGFNTAEDSGSDSDSLWNNAAKHFFKKHNLPKINLREIRFTGADIVRANENDDARAVQAALGQRSQSTNETFYDAAGAKRRRDESLVQGQNAQVRWARTGGKVDSRTGAENESFLGATPGFDCIDPLHSPIESEIQGRPCGAYARCPGCAHAMANHTSPRNLARFVQLREEMDRAKGYLPPARWELFQKSREKLDSFIQGFTDPKVIAEAEKMELRPLPPLE